jgi:hypothetical protein
VQERTRHAVVGITAHENRFFGRLMDIGMTEALRVRAVGQWLLDARPRGRLFDAIESLREAPVRPTPLVRRCAGACRLFSALTLLAWATWWPLCGWHATEKSSVCPGYRPGGVAVAGVVVSLLLLGLAIGSSARLPDDVGFAPAGPYLRRLR